MKIIEEINNYLYRLFPITRSITGEGNRRTLEIINEIVPLNVQEYPSGMKVYDWIIPKEWNIRDAWIKNSKGLKVIDFKDNNIHIMNYSIPIHKKIPLNELKMHLHFLEEKPDAIPYKTSYYNDNWGFCVSYDDYRKYFNEDEEYEICIDSDFKNGTLTLADVVLPGKSKKEYLFSTYICHPSLANDNLSGLLLSAFLARELLNKERTNSYRFVFAPETIGAITYCATHENIIKNIIGGYIITCVAGRGNFGYKQTFLGNHLIDKAAVLTLKEKSVDFIQYSFVPQGSDERQYSSPGFRIPVGSVHKDKYHEYDEYHTSLDNLNFISAGNLFQTFEIYKDIIYKLENDCTFISKNPHCEPQLGKRGLYPEIGRRTVGSSLQEGKSGEIDDPGLLQWLLFFADGKNSALAIAENLNVPFKRIINSIGKLESNNLILTQ